MSEEVPKHKCCFKARRYLKCNHYIGPLIWYLYIRSDFVRVTHCPWCGEKLEVSE